MLHIDNEVSQTAKEVRFTLLAIYNELINRKDLKIPKGTTNHVAINSLM